MKTSHLLRFVKHHVIALGCACSLLLSASFGPALMAAEYILTSDSPIPATTAFADGDVFKISGSSGSVTLADGRTLTVNEWVTVGAYDVRSGSNITFKQEDADPGTWALMQNNAIGVRLMRYEAARTSLTLDRVILGDIVYNNQGGALYVASAAAGHLVINGDAIFTNIRATMQGGAISIQNGSLTFTGTVIFDQCRAGYTAATGTFSTTHNGGAIYSAGAAATCVLTFENDVFFFSNTAANQGGAIFANTSSQVVFEKEAALIGNTARNGTGGAIMLVGGASAAFSGDALLEGNKAAGDGGAIYATSAGKVTFNGVSGTVTFKDNFAAAAGGAIMGGAIDFSAARLSLEGNSAVSNGGAFRVNNALTISSGVLDIAGNHAGSAGGALNVGSLDIAASGTISSNIAGANGGAIQTGNAIITSVAGLTFANNTSGTYGGAIYLGGQSELALNAAGGDILFEGNTSGAVIDSSQLATGGGLSITTAGTSNAIHFNAATGTLSLNAGAGRAIRFHDAISASDTTVLTVNKTGAGSVIFREHASNVVANTTVEEGTFQLSGGAIYGVSNNAGSFEVKSGATLAINGRLRAGSITFANGTVLEAIENGIVSLDSASPISFGTGLTLAGSGTFSTPLTAAKISVGSGTSAPQTLAFTDNVTLLDGGTIDIDLYIGAGLDGYGLSDRINLAGGGTIALAGNNRIDIGIVQSGTFNLGSIGNLYGNITLTINGEVPAEVGRQSGLLMQSGANLLVITSADMSRDMTWAGASGNTTWNLTSENWTDFGGVTRFGGGDRVIFSSAAGALNVEINPNGVNVSDMWVEGDASYTFTGSGGIAANASHIIEVGGVSAVTNPEGKLVKRGAGTLAFANTAGNVFTGGIDIHGGAIAFANSNQIYTAGAPITFVGSGTLMTTADYASLDSNIVIADGKIATLHNSVAYFTYSGTVTGPNATLAKTGSRLLTFAGSADIGTLEVNSGKLAITGNVRASNAVTIAKQGVLAIPTTAALTTGGAAFTMTNKGVLQIGNDGIRGSSYAKVSINGNYASDNGSILLAIGATPDGNAVLCDELNVTGSVTGNVNIIFSQQTAITGDADWSNVTPLTTTDPASVTAEINCAPIELTNGLLRTLIRNPDGTWTYSQGGSSTLPLLLGVDAASIMTGKASMASLSQRLVTNRATAPHTFQAWVNGIMTDEQIKLSSYRDSDISTYGAQVGIDWSTAIGKGRLTLGAFYDNISSDMSQSAVISGNTSTKTKATGYGIYGTCVIGNWYVDLLVRAGSEDYDIKVPGNPTFSTNGDSIAGALEIGRSFKKNTNSPIHWEPQLQFTWQTHDINNATDYLDRTYAIDSADSLEGRLGMRIWLERELKPGWKIVPFLRASYHYEFKGATGIAVGDRVYNNDLGGSKGIVDIGAIMQIGSNFGVNAKVSCGFGERTKGFSLDLGCGFFW